MHFADHHGAEHRDMGHEGYRRYANKNYNMHPFCDKPFQLNFLLIDRPNVCYSMEISSCIFPERMPRILSISKIMHSDILTPFEGMRSDCDIMHLVFWMACAVSLRPNQIAEKNSKCAVAGAQNIWIRKLKCFKCKCYWIYLISHLDFCAAPSHSFLYVHQLATEWLFSVFIFRVCKRCKTVFCEQEIDVL